MKLLVAALLLISASVLAQKSPVFRIDSLPKQGVLLDKDWKFQLADNPDFAKPDFDDSKWESIDPTKDIFDLPQLPKTEQIFWLRLHLVVDSSLNQQMVMMIQQSGASEVFLNGKMIQKLGVLSTNLGEIKAFNPQERIFSFPIQKANSQILAVRYAFQPTMQYATHFGRSNVALSITLFSPENWYIHNISKQYAHDLDVAVGSIYIVLCLLYFAFYLFFSKRKINLYFTIYTFLYSLPYCISGFLHNLDIRDWYWVSNTFIITSIVASLFLLLSVYRLFESKISFFYWLILLFGIICIPLAFIFYSWGWVVYGMGFNLLVSFEILRISIKGIINHQKGAWIIAIGSFIFFLFWFLFLLGTSVFQTDYAPYYYALAQLGIPLSVAIFLGYDFAQTNRSLQEKLLENEALAAEKQQILASQNELLEQQVEARTRELKASQAQLIQSEKMASLGELTAGIAHEIQNPLNFVNNYSEVNVELIEELSGELENGNVEEAKIIVKDLVENENKIHHHGQRADAIVRSMLQHSRTHSSTKELTDLNQLADEYLRLAYHGLRAKDSSFQADYSTDFDENLPLVEVVTQDIGRVLLNIINNAFQAVAERKQMEQTGYLPKVKVATKNLGQHVELTVQDNGNGIPEAIKDKIFQPFFTTKPTGQGTGLGLSLAYESVKAHGGTFEVVSVEGEGAEFVICLPVQNN